MEEWPILRKKCYLFALFPFNNPSLSQMIIFIYSTYPFLLPSCPPNPLSINHIFFWKTKLKHTDVDITRFFQDTKPSLSKRKSVS